MEGGIRHIIYYILFITYDMVKLSIFYIPPVFNFSLQFHFLDADDSTWHRAR